MHKVIQFVLVLIMIVVIVANWNINVLDIYTLLFRSFPKYDHYRSPSQDQRLPSESQQPRSSSYDRHLETYGDYGRIYPDAPRDNYPVYGHVAPPKPERSHAAYSNQVYMDHQDIARENPPGREVYSQDSGYPSSLERSR